MLALFLTYACTFLLSCYCQTVEEYKDATELTCDSEFITVKMQKDLHDQASGGVPYTLELLDTTCVLTGDTTLEKTFSLIECGTIREFFNGAVKYKNSVQRVVAQPNDENVFTITRVPIFKIDIVCIFNAEGFVILEGGYMANNQYSDLFGISLLSYKYDDFAVPYSGFPETLATDTDLFFEIGNLDISSAKVLVKKCWSSTSETATASNDLVLIDNGCVANGSHVELISEPGSDALGRFKIIKNYLEEYIAKNTSSYIHCDVAICDDVDFTNSRCAQGCMLNSGDSSNADITNSMPIKALESVTSGGYILIDSSGGDDGIGGEAATAITIAGAGAAGTTVVGTVVGTAATQQQCQTMAGATAP